MYSILRSCAALYEFSSGKHLISRIVAIQFKKELTVNFPIKNMSNSFSFPLIKKTTSSD